MSIAETMPTLNILRQRSDLPLSDDPAARILPWIVGLMVYLATLTLAGALLVSGLAADWSAGLTGTVTIHIVSVGDESEAEMTARVGKAVRIALKTPGVESAGAVPPEQVAALLAPWLGGDAPIAELPLPRIIDVQLAPDAVTDIAALKARLDAAIPGAGLDDHQLWRDRLVQFLFAIEAAAAVMVLLIGAATVTMVVFATRSGLSVHNEVIEVLHVIGAHDEYIAHQIQTHALNLGLKSAIIGSLAGLITLLAIAQTASNLDLELFPSFLFRLWHWPVLATVPVIAAFIVRFSARRTVLQALRKLL